GNVVVSEVQRVRAQGVEELQGSKGPVGTLPNPRGSIDPPLVLSVLWPVLRPRPLAFEGNFKNPVVWPLMKLLNAVPVPDLDQASMQARAQARQAVQTVIESLQKGENVIMWPAGHLQHNGTERLGGAPAPTHPPPPP